MYIWLLGFSPSQDNKLTDSGLYSKCEWSVQEETLEWDIDGGGGLNCMRLSSRVRHTVRGGLLQADLCFQTLGLDSSCAGPLWGWQPPTPPRPSTHGGYCCVCCQYSSPSYDIWQAAPGQQGMMEVAGAGAGTNRAWCRLISDWWMQDIVERTH